MFVAYGFLHCTGVSVPPSSPISRCPRRKPSLHRLYDSRAGRTNGAWELIEFPGRVMNVSLLGRGNRAASIWEKRE